MSIGVRPTLQLATDSGLEIGESGGLLVNDTCKLQMNIFMGRYGDENRVSSKG